MKYDLNTITADELTSLGISRTLATRIVYYREELNGFADIIELLNIRNLGEKTYLKLKEHLYVQHKTDDLVKVIRCKNCKYSREIGEDYLRCDHPDLDYDVECWDHWLNVWPHDFCSSAEPKE